MTKTLRIVLPFAIILLFVVSQAGVGGDATDTTNLATSASQSNAGGTASPKPASTSVESIRDGAFAFVVTSIQRPGRTLASKLGTQTAQGEFVIVRVDVTNLGGEAKPLAPTGQFLISDGGQRFAPSPAVTSLNGAESAFLRSISPGGTVTGAKLLFDLAPGTPLASIELHDSLSSPGVQVKLP